MDTKSITDGTRIKRKNTILTSNIETQTIMMSLEKGNYYGLNSVGSRIWELIEQEISVKDICVRLIDEYEVEEKHCKKVVVFFLEEMEKSGLISIL